MYQFARKTHLYSALVLFVFVLLYAVSGYLLEFPLSRVLKSGAATTRSQAFQFSGKKGSAECAAYVKETYDLHGQLKGFGLDQRTGTQHYSFVGAKAAYDARVSSDGTRITITTQPFVFAATLIRMHHFAGFDGGAIYEIWGVMVDAVCVAMLVFAFSGVYLWYKLTKRHALGWIVLTISISYTTATAIYCVCAR